jgi:hypothetical protein
MNSNLLGRMGGRKFALAVLASLQTAVLAWAGRIDPGVYSAVMIATVGAFIAGNAWQHIQQRRGDAPPAGQ